MSQSVFPESAPAIGAVAISSLPDEGQQTMANSISVAIASNQTAVPISGTISVGTPTVNQGTGGSSAWKVDGSAVTQPVSAASLPLPSGASTEATLALIKAKTDNIDVALSTRTKPADSQHVVIDSSATITVTGLLTDTQLRASAVPVSLASLPNPSNLDVALSTRLKAADTLAGITTVGTLTSITNPVAVTGTFWQATQPVSAVALPLPTNAAKESGGSLDLIVTNTNPLLDSSNGAYMRQDNSGTIAKESGGNLETLAAVSFSTSDNQDYEIRLIELSNIRKYEQGMRNLMATEMHTSNRMGFELR